MQKAVLILFLMFLVLGISVNVPVLLADGDDNRSGSNNGSDSNSITDDSGSSDDDDDKNETETEDENETKFRERSRERFVEGDCTIKVERKIKTEDGKRVEFFKKKVECADGTKTEIQIKIENSTEGGRFRERIKYEVHGEEIDVEAGEGVDLEEESNATHYSLKARLRNGNITYIKIMPDQASEIALERLRALNFTVELRESVHKNIPRVVYNIETNKHGRFLGIFKLSLKVDGEVDPETGEFIGISKPWWAFLVAGEDSEQTEDENEAEIEEETEIKAETFNGTSEIKIKLEFGTNATEQEQIVTEVLNRLSDLNISNLLEIEENDEAIEDEEKLKVEAEVDDVTEVEFEWRFIIDSDNSEEIINAVTNRISGLTSEDISSGFNFETENELEAENETEED